MRAIRQDRLGGPEVMELVEVDRPAPIPTEVLVRVHAAGVNPADWKVRSSGSLGLTPPLTLGWDVSGVVEELGFATSIFAVGDEVLGMPWFPRPANAAERGVRTSPILVEPDHAGLQDLVDLVEADKLKVVVEQTFPLADVAKAHEVGEAGRVVGKLVLTV